MRSFGYLMAIMLVSACSHSIKMDSNAPAVGQYRVAAVEIVPTQYLEADDQPEFATIQPMLAEALIPKLSGRGMGADVILRVEVTDVNLSIDAVQAVLVSDSYSIMENIVLLDAQTRRPLGERLIMTRGELHQGIYGAVVGSGSSAAAIQNLVEKNASQIVETIYPKR